MPNRVELKIIVDDTGRIQVTGPIHDKALSYGLLEVARAAIKDHTDQLAKSQISHAKPSDIPAPPRDRRLHFET